MFRDRAKAEFCACAARGLVQEISKHLLNLHMTKNGGTHDNGFSLPKLVTSELGIRELFELRECHQAVVLVDM
jgi:hypothetical protein